MNPVSDEDLVLYHYRDGLPRERLAEIEDALFTDDALRRRYERLRAELNAAGGAFAVTAPDAAFEARIWRGVRRGLPREPLGARVARWLAPREGGRLALALMVVAALALGWMLGRSGQAPAPAVATQAPLLERDAGERVLASYLAQHLETTERALMIAANSDDADGTARELAQHLAHVHTLGCGVAVVAALQLNRFAGGGVKDPADVAEQRAQVGAEVFQAAGAGLLVVVVAAIADQARGHLFDECDALRLIGAQRSDPSGAGVWGTDLHALGQRAPHLGPGRGDVVPGHNFDAGAVKVFGKVTLDLFGLHQ